MLLKVKQVNIMLKLMFKVDIIDKFNVYQLI